MAVKLASLKNDPKYRKVRDMVVVGNDTITIYEPTAEDVDRIIDLQEEFFSDESNEIRIDGADVVRHLFPLLTDIEGMDDLTDDEIEDIVENPTVALSQVEQHIKIIITEVYKNVVLAVKSDLLEADLASETNKAERNMFDQAFKFAAKEVGREDLLDKLNILSADVKDAIQREATKMTESQSAESIMTFIPPTVEPQKVDIEAELEENNQQLKAKRLLDKYRKDFSNDTVVPLVEKNDD